MYGGASLLSTLDRNYKNKAASLFSAAVLSTIPAGVTNGLMNWITRGMKSRTKKSCTIWSQQLLIFIYFRHRDK